MSVCLSVCLSVFLSVWDGWMKSLLLQPELLAVLLLLHSFQAIDDCWLVMPRHREREREKVAHTWVRKKEREKERHKSTQLSQEGQETQTEGRTDGRMIVVDRRTDAAHVKHTANTNSYDVSRRWVLMSWRSLDKAEEGDRRPKELSHKGWAQSLHQK